jgi:lipoprotein-anchoring transpeptidase ErfK/SrfK
MRVYLDHKLIRTIKVSTGRDQYPTKGGVHIVLTREKSHIYNSGTVGIPTNGPGGYYETLPWSMRISNGGAFVHANPQTVGVQGLRNVSHGCVNTSVTDAKWFYYHSQLGDPVNIIHAVVKPVKWDAGMADWNYTWAEWKSGNLDG